MEDITWESVNHVNCRFVSKQQLIEEVSGYIQAIAEITGKSNNDQIKVYGIKRKIWVWEEMTQ